MIFTYRSRKTRHVRGTKVSIGDELHAIRKGNLFFIWSYTDREMAEHMDDKLTGPESEVDRSANWRKSTTELTPTNTKIK